LFKKVKARYAEKKTKTDRDVMSYEDMPLDDYEQEKTEMSPEAAKKIIAGICIAIVAGLIVFAFSNRDKLTWDNLSTWWTYDVLGNAGDGYPVNIVGSEVISSNFEVSQGRVAYASDTSFVTLNSTGSEIADFQLRYSSPVMKSSGTKYLTFGLGSTDFQIYNVDEKLYSGEAEENIFTGDIASNGVYCIVTEGNGYFSCLYVFDKNNNRIYKYSFSEYYITSVSLNSDGSGCIACGITSDNGAVSGGVYMLNFKKEEPEAFYQISSDSIIDCKYLGDSRAVLIGQTASYLIRSGEDEYLTTSYEDKTLANYCFNTDTNTYTLALSRSGDGRSCSLLQYDNNGTKKCEFDTDYSAESISTYKGVISILDDNTAYLYNTSALLLGSCDAGTGSKRVVLTDESHAYILSVNQIRLIDFNSTSTNDTAS
jgi:hypothetical protein